MNRLVKIQVWYSILSCALSLLSVLLLLLFPLLFVKQDTLSGVIFFLLMAGYFNCLPLAIVSIFMFFRQGMRKYSIANFVAIVIVLCFVVRVFGKSI